MDTTTSSSASVTPSPNVAAATSSPNATATTSTPTVDLTDETRVKPPPAKRYKKSTSDVWEHFMKYDKTVKDEHGNDFVELWTKCNKSGCKYVNRRESSRGTSVFRSHLKHQHNILMGQQILNLKKSEGNESAASVETYRYKRNVIKFYAPRIYPGTSMQEIEKFTMVVNQLFQAYASTSKNTTSSDANVHQVASQLDVDGDDDLDMFLHSKNATDHGTKIELKVYLEQPLAPRNKDFDILSWWKIKQVEFPIISQLAYDVLSMQVSTVASESAFSAGGRVVDPFRSRLDPETVQALVCTKDWTAASKGGKIASVIIELDIENLE